MDIAEMLKKHQKIKEVKIEEYKGIEAHQRYYNEAGELLPGVTTITGQLEKPALIHWAWSLGMQQKDYRKYRDKTADAGTLGHSLIQCHLLKIKPDLTGYSQDVIDKAENAVISFYEWEKGHKIVPIFLEKQLVSEVNKYGGTLDCYVILDGLETLIDLKTSPAIYPEMEIQVAAYWKLLVENGYNVKQVRIIRVGRDESEGFEDRLIPFETLEIQWQIFLRLLDIYYLKKQIRAKKYW